MDHTSPPSPSPDPLASLRSGLGFAARMLIGALLICVASAVAMMTALAGLMLAAAALTLRFVAVRQPAPIPVRIKDTPVTLQARRTPRGWTIE